jgi:hypothetical protein
MYSHVSLEWSNDLLEGGTTGAINLSIILLFGNQLNAKGKILVFFFFLVFYDYFLLSLNFVNQLNFSPPICNEADVP